MRGMTKRPTDHDAGQQGCDDPMGSTDFRWSVDIKWSADIEWSIDIMYANARPATQPPTHTHSHANIHTHAPKHATAPPPHTQPRPPHVPHSWVLACSSVLYHFTTACKLSSHALVSCFCTCACNIAQCRCAPSSDNTGSNWSSHALVYCFCACACNIMQCKWVQHQYIMLSCSIGVQGQRTTHIESDLRTPWCRASAQHHAVQVHATSCSSGSQHHLVCVSGY